VISLKKEFLILIYEKEKLLNSILDYQISNYNNSKSHCVNNSEDLFLDISKKKFDTYILNLNDLDNDLERFLDTFQIKNTHTNIIGYYENNFKSLKSNETQLFLLKKPFRLITLLNQLENIKTLNNLENANKTLMSHIIFSPSKKIISNLETKKIEHLTEKENNLLTYFFDRKNVEILKKDLLTNIWGVSDEINTHTLETHIYRLKQKLYKLDSNLSFSLINKNGLYLLKYNDYDVKS
jgi:DNA-binding response OmpR family regulator